MSVPFTVEMKKTHTILVPSMLPIHFQLIKKAFESEGYKFDVMDEQGPEVIREGLRYVHNDICYPAQLVIGQFITTLKSGRYDTHKVALMITQTGGGCRASNYIFLLRKALAELKMEYIPVLSLNFKHMEENPGFKLTIPFIMEGYAACIYGDLLTTLANQTRPYEITKGQTDALVKKWVDDLGVRFENKKNYFGVHFGPNFRRIVHEFAKIPVKRVPKIKVGIVGEIYMKYSSLGNNGLQKFLEDQGCEVMIPNFLDFIYYGFDNAKLDRKYYGHLLGQTLYTQFALKVLFHYEKLMLDAIKTESCFVCPSSYRAEKKLDKGVLDYGVKMGEGWLLTSEMLELVHLGYKNIICTQPFGCLPNHICAKGMFRTVRAIVPDANIVPIDYDPSASHVNQENRIKLMLAVAKENLAKEQAAKEA